MKKNDYITKILRKYPYICQMDLEETYEIAKRELFITLYSCNTSMITEETEIPYAFEYKVLEAMKEIIDLGPMRNFTSYQENGFSYTRPAGGLLAYRNINSLAEGV